MKKIVVLLAFISLLAACQTDSGGGSNTTVPEPVTKRGVESYVEGKAFNFTIFGDIQAGYTTTWPMAVTTAQLNNPEMAVYVGDITDTPSDWTRWSAYAPQAPTIVAVGNHEYDSNTYRNQNWNKFLEFPQNGPDKVTATNTCDKIHQEKQLEEVKNTVYYTDYKDVRFITLNSMTREARRPTQGDGAILVSNGCSTSEPPYTAWLQLQKVWLGELLENSPAKFNVVVFHHPIVASVSGRNNEIFRENWGETLSGADLVLTGHDHIYSRAEYLGTQYISINSGNKFYPFSNSDWNRAGISPIKLIERESLIGLAEVGECLTVDIVNVDTKNTKDSVEVC